MLVPFFASPYHHFEDSLQSISSAHPFILRPIDRALCLLYSSYFMSQQVYLKSYLIFPLI